MDPQTINVLATTTVGILTPYLAKAGEAVVKKIGEDLYQTLKTRFSQKPAAQEALNDLARAPEDTDLQATLRVQVKKLLAEDETFAAQVQRLLREVGSTEAGAAVIKQVAGDNAKQFGQVFGNVTFGQD
jgi:uncharacterized protein YllA (UPF0747 family)